MPELIRAAASVARGELKAFDEHFLNLQKINKEAGTEGVLEYIQLLKTP